ncbi:hypothetical protein G7Y89_g9065 [Cudoniella acicularis]|uniref:Cytochrome P450 n=1 Tax=Cudoniella acicularis TaxID=354080 RepID=A0A8H4W296_9HELO|nr:hypothetical protein G7Y89_g9065 [Cudoniella acicularis]
MAKVNYEYTSLSGNGRNRIQRILRVWTCKDSALVVLVLAVLGLIVKTIIDGRETCEINNSAFTFGAIGLESQPHVHNYSWFTEYSTVLDEDEDYVDKLWDEIIPGHGIVAVNHEWAAQKGFPKSISLPSNDTKGIYVIDAYHQIHCLTIVRKTFYEVLRKKRLTWPIEHSMHCFDNFRQYIQCTAGDTLLYTWGKNTTGDGQQRRCQVADLIRLIRRPKLAALTSWYEFYYDVIQPGQYIWHIQKLHAKYGPVIRIGPGEVHFKDPDFLDEIYAPASRKRDKYWFNQRAFKGPESVGATVKHELHRRRREALNPFFSTKSVATFEPIIQEKVSKLQALIEKHIQNQTPINFSDVYFGFAQDVVSHYSFGHDKNLLENENKAAIERNNMLELLSRIKLSQHLPWIANFLSSIPFSVAKHMMPAGVLNNIALDEEVSRDVQTVLNDPENLKKGKQRSIFYELRDNQNLPPSEKSLNRLKSEGVLLIMAGTESTSKSLTITHFYLLHHEHVLARVRAELQSIPHPASWLELQKLPYLSGCIAEGNRLSFGVTSRMRRVAPDETLEYKQYRIPPGTPFSQSTLSVHTDESIFPDPWSFRPERWLGKEGMELRKYQMAFNKGSRSCVGINLAHAEMFLVIAAVARYDMKLYQTDEIDVKFQHDFQVSFPERGSKGVRAVVKGQYMSSLGATNV